MPHRTQVLTTAIELCLVDDGLGFIPTNNTTGFGLQRMRERVLSLQGKFEHVSHQITIVLARRHVV